MHSALMVYKHPVPSLVEGLQYIYHAWQCQLELLLKAIETSRDTSTQQQARSKGHLLVDTDQLGLRHQHLCGSSTVWE